MTNLNTIYVFVFIKTLATFFSINVVLKSVMRADDQVLNRPRRFCDDVETPFCVVDFFVGKKHNFSSL